MADALIPSRRGASGGKVSSTGRTPSPVDVTIGQRIRAFRRSRGLSQDELAREIGISANQVHKYETGHNRVSAGMLFLIARPLGIAPGAFYQGIENDEGQADLPDTIATGRITRRFRRVLNRADPAVRLSRRLRRR